MKVYTTNERNAMPLEDLIRITLISPTKVDKENIHTNVFYLNDEGMLVWDLFKNSWSKTEPLSSLKYNVVKEK